MSHLKSFGRRLENIFTPKVQPLIICGTSKDYILTMKCNSSLNLSRRLADFSIPSLKMTASHNKLVSLSAPLIGVNSRAIILHTQPVSDKWEDYQCCPEDYKVIINPQIRKYSAEKQTKHEECSAIPTLYFEVERSIGIQIEYLDVNGYKMIEEFYDFEARVILHEMDHIDGVLPSDLSVCQGKTKKKYNFIEMDKVENYYSKLVKEEYGKLNALYDKDKEFKMKTDKQKDRKEFFYKIILGNEKYQEYLTRTTQALKLDVSRGKIKYD